MLYSIYKNSVKDEKFDFDTIFEFILSRHPYKNLIKNHSSIYDFTLNLWKSVVKDALDNNYLSIDNNLFTLTDKSIKTIDVLLKTRENLLSKGYSGLNDSLIERELLLTDSGISQAA